MKCPRCEGNGKCVECKGSGFVTCSNCNSTGTVSITLPSGVEKNTTCKFCNGKGAIQCNPLCESCAGKGEISSELQKEMQEKYSLSLLMMKEHIVRVSTIILAINIVCYILTLVLQQISGHNVMLRMGSMYTPAVIAGQWWRLVTSIFLHVDIMHFLLNSYCLIIICPPIEKILGSFKFFVLYMLSGLAGNALSFFLLPTLPSAGASGALFGVLGAYFGLNVRQKIFESAYISQLMIWLGINVVIGIMPGSNINMWAHIGGFACGFIFSSFIKLR
ncbi:MAG: rhomboid family intramembrane serine protease [Candidatus Eremiobacteraeota bacterium]|nr:rhomboid family intramembrane serine protease [Candidatus Eremiobacteraeota bacterium]